MISDSLFFVAMAPPPGANNQIGQSSPDFTIGWIVFLGLIILFLLKITSRMFSTRLSFGPALVLKKFHLNDQAKHDQLIVEIAGRSPGIISWILTSIGFDTQTIMTVSLKQVLVRQSSLYGQIDNFVPIEQICRVAGGYTRNIGLLLLAGLSALVGLALWVSMGTISAFFASLFVAILCATVYILQKKLSVFIETSGGSVFGLTFKRSVIENVAVDIEKVKEMIALINKIVLQ